MFLFGPQEFIAYSQAGKAVPLVFEIDTGNETPVIAYRKFGGGQGTFLLDSAGESKELNEYSFVGLNPFLTIETCGSDPLSELREAVTRFSPGALPIDAPVWGGAFGFLSYDCARYVEKIPETAEDDLELPEAVFVFPGLLLVFDHDRRKTLVIINEVIGHDPAESLRAAEMKLDAALNTLKHKADTPASAGHSSSPSTGLNANIRPDGYEAIVRRAKEYIFAGDIFQTNLSVRFEVPISSDPFSLYMSLRSVNPSPFAAFLDFGQFQLASSSPERLVRIKQGIAETRPIAGTRRRGADEKEDDSLTADLLLNEKERAEHVMLVDLERNDLGRISKSGTVRPTELFAVEKYSHVIHIVSNIAGEVADGYDQFDVARAVFPGGTITGCPKVRCMEIIEELEPNRRGPYTGSIGYFGFNGNMDTNIIIRTFVIIGDRAYVQAGAGIVADSDPSREYFEAVSKATALFKAAGIAQEDVKWEMLPI